MKWGKEGHYQQYRSVELARLTFDIDVRNSASPFMTWYPLQRYADMCTSHSSFAFSNWLFLSYRDPRNGPGSV